MIHDGYIANVYELHNANKEKLKKKLYNEILSQYKESKPIIDWVIEYLLGKSFLLGIEHWQLWRYQNGIWLDRSVDYNFGISRTFDDVILNDDELMELANLSAITNLSHSFLSTAEAINNEDTNLIGVYSLRGLFLYYACTFSDNVIKGILKFHKLYRPLYSCFLLNLPSDAKQIPYYFRRNGNYPQPVYTSSRRRFVNGRQYAVKRLQVQNYYVLN